MGRLSVTFKQPLRKLYLTRRWLALFLVLWLIIGLVTAIVVVWTSYNNEQQQRYQQLEGWCGERARSLTHQLQSSSDHAKVGYMLQLKIAVYRLFFPK